jgi:hypothetical protein
MHEGRRIAAVQLGFSHLCPVEGLPFAFFGGGVGVRVVVLVVCIFA